MSGSTLGGGITVNLGGDPASREFRALAAGRSLLGGTIAGLAANIIGGAYPLASTLGVATAFVFVAMLAVQLRRLPARAPLHRLVARAGLGGAAVAVAASLVVPPTWTGWTVLLAAALGMAGSLTPAPAEDTLRQITGAALVGFGVAGVGLGVALLLDSQLLIGVAEVGVGVAVVGAGVASLLDSQLLIGVAGVGVGVAFVGGGVAFLLDSQLLLGVALVGLGVAVVGFGAAVLLDSQLLFGVAGVGAGVALLGAGVAFLLDSQLLFGVALVGGGVAVAGVGLLDVGPPLITCIRRLASDPPGRPAAPGSSPPDDGGSASTG